MERSNRESDHTSHDGDEDKQENRDESKLVENDIENPEDWNPKLDSAIHEMSPIKEPVETENEDLGNLSLKLESEDELPELESIKSSRAFKSCAISAKLPTFSDDETSDSDHFSQRTRRKLDKLKKTTEECDRKFQSDYLGIRSKMYEKKGRSILNRSIKFTQNSSKREAVTDTDSFACVPSQSKKNKVGQVRKRVRKSGSDSTGSGSQSGAGGTCDKWLSKGEIREQGSEPKKSKRKWKFSSDAGDTSETTDFDIDDSSPARMQKRVRLSDKDLRKQENVLSSPSKRGSDVLSDSDEENKSPNNGRYQRQTKSITNTLADRRISLNVTSDNCDFKRWVSDCKQIEYRRRTLAKSLSKSSQSDVADQPVLDEVFENGKRFATH